MATGTFPKTLRTVLEFRTSLMYFIAHRVSAKRRIKSQWSILLRYINKKKA